MCGGHSEQYTERMQYICQCRQAWVVCTACIASGLGVIVFGPESIDGGKTGDEKYN